ncbi:hypothetical protein CRG98_037690 [Punica granatum]|uniref:Amine oxidase n=1 Tax=Punica granatum TaxID=22663 RepID=A0A2I0IE58_PUNGR|nr:hypothetical protein CRG98_037690 [Punica granatum]
MASSVTEKAVPCCSSESPELAVSDWTQHPEDPAHNALPLHPVKPHTSHPLDPLSAAEISVAVATVRAAGATPEVRDGMRFIEVVLVEPDKHIVALADAKSNETSVWIVELSEVHASTRGGHHRGKVISSKVVPDVQPPMAMKRRGIEDMDLVMVDPWNAGYYSEADAPSRRLSKPLVFCRSESDCPMENGYARPVEGLHILVDMQNMVVLEFEDRKLVPLPPVDPLRNYTRGVTRGGVDRSDVKPLLIIQPEGPSFRVDGHFVEWQKVRNTRTVNRTGQLTGYKLVPGSNCLPLAGDEAFFLRRGAFVKHNLWVTRYAPDEMYPGGEFPNQNPRVREGLATWVQQNRSLEEADVVLCFAYPKAARMDVSLIMQPYGFFNCSPAVDVPPNASVLDHKEDGMSTKAISNGLIAKL